MFICDECVEVCNDILADDARFEERTGSKADKRTDDSPAPWPNMIHCALCRAAIPAKDGFVIENRGILCAACMSAVQAASASSQ